MPFHKGQTGNPFGRKKGSKNVKTIARENRRAVLDNEITKLYMGLIHKAKPEYLLDQFVGKSTENIDITSGGKPIVLPLEIYRQNKADEEK